jgi:hypothetical protein
MLLKTIVAATSPWVRISRSPLKGYRQNCQFRTDRTAVIVFDDGAVV